MFWRMTALSASSPVESVLDKENFTLEELLDEEEVIQECKALNSRLINFLRDRAQVEQLLHYIVEEAPEDAESKRVFKFPFIACEIIICEIDVILKTLVEEEELMSLLFSFLEPNRPHSTLLAGYFSKVVVCLMVRKTVPLMNYVQAHQDVFRQLVDLIGITSIMEVLVRLVGADDHVYPNFMDVMQWLADSSLLEMIVDKLSPCSPPEVHANAAETLCAITWNASSALATKLLSPSFVARIFGHALEDSQSKSGLIHSLSVCISLLNPKRSASPMISSFRSQHLYEPPVPVNHETVSAMLPKLGDLLMLLDVSSDDRVLQTTYGELRPPLGKHRLKIVEFISVLLRTGNEVAEKELVNSSAIQRVLNLFFEYPFNNSLHHHVESIILSCLESKNITIIDHLFRDCNLIEKFLQADRLSILSGDSNKPTLTAAGKQVPRAGYIGHLTRISNKLIQLGHVNSHVHAYLQESSEWIEWQGTILQERNNVENVYRWACGRPTALQEKTRDSDDELNDRDYDVTTLANNLSQAFRYNMFEHEETEEVNGSLERDDEDVYFDDDSAEVVISSLRLGDDQESLFTNSNWFAFQEDRIGNEPLSTSLSETMDEINLNGTTNGGSSSSDDEVVVGEDEELVDGMVSGNGASSSSSNFLNGCAGSDPAGKGGVNPPDEKSSASGDLDFFQYATADNNPFCDRPLPDWMGWQESADLQNDGSSRNPFSDSYVSDADLSSPIGPAGNSLPNGEVNLPNGMSTIDASLRSTVPSLFEEDVEFVGVELEGTERAMEQALKEGIVGEAGPLKRNLSPKGPEKEKPNEDGSGIFEFNDANYWRVDQEIAVVQE
ncbi:serine/threonine-protein phosphatase 6 regulatory subunit 3-like isoform X2 [Macadamia integrifolia]|uniref:serine/threonine-protein phosphatase 6 regulatory subunit 3-like isoform X2 n=1 Tax=Macadamia integrifolia TaxID=60698 RepID=UPI001C52F23B|nr:serine/threonine-protein phosphatase 6 regulatory subunit 3-like isoform X2 [Macadamia integrifolia]